MLALNHALYAERVNFYVDWFPNEDFDIGKRKWMMKNRFWVNNILLLKFSKLVKVSENECSTGNRLQVHPLEKKNVSRIPVTWISNYNYQRINSYWRCKIERAVLYKGIQRHSCIFATDLIAVAKITIGTFPPTALHDKKRFIGNSFVIFKFTSA